MRWASIFNLKLPRNYCILTPARIWGLYDPLLPDLDSRYDKKLSWADPRKTGHIQGFLLEHNIIRYIQRQQQQRDYTDNA